MKTRIVAVLCMAVGLAGCGGGGAVPKMSPLPADGVILSYAAGPNPQADLFRDQKVDEVIGKRVGLVAVHRGIPGELSQDALLRLPAELDDVKPALLVLGYGAADLAQKSDRAALKANLAAMIDLARSRQVQVVMLGLPNLTAGVSLESDPIYAELAREKGVPIENEALKRVLSRRSLKAYTMVPNEQGILQLGAAVHELLLQSGALPPGG